MTNSVFTQSQLAILANPPPLTPNQLEEFTILHEKGTDWEMMSSNGEYGIKCESEDRRNRLFCAFYISSLFFHQKNIDVYGHVVDGNMRHDYVPNYKLQDFVDKMTRRIAKNPQRHFAFMASVYNPEIDYYELAMNNRPIHVIENHIQ